ncbi:MAG: LysE family translocator [Candidatus Synoicihabitans palmerolidicus]|nr:LysE family translocator [Candidatus Synoicihabitans palmerolidicus]
MMAHGLAVVSPGPDFALVLRQSLQHGRRVTVITALGIGCGILVHVSYVLLGITVVFREWPMLFAVVRYVGAGYLGWLGWQALRSRGTSRPEAVEHNSGR